MISSVCEFYIEKYLYGDWLLCYSYPDFNTCVYNYDKLISNEKNKFVKYRIVRKKTIVSVIEESDFNDK